jgi:hypothetical protein
MLPVDNEMKKNEMSRACGTHGGKLCKTFLDVLKERYHYEHLGLNRKKMIIKYILKR